MNALLCLKERVLLTITAAGLSRRGIHTVEANDAQEALEILSGGLTFDVFFLDLDMLPRGAEEIISKAKFIAEKMPIVLTGGNESVVGRLSQPEMEFLSKPFTCATLIATFERAIMLNEPMTIASFWEALEFSEAVLKTVDQNNQDETQGPSFLEILKEKGDAVVRALVLQTGNDPAHFFLRLEPGMQLDATSRRAVADLIFWLKTYRT